MLYWPYNLKFSLFVELVLYPLFLVKQPTKLIFKTLYKGLYNILPERLKIFLNVPRKIFYYVYLYNLVLLVRILANKYVYLKTIENEVHVFTSLKGSALFSFIDLWSLVILPMFESFQITLNSEDILEYRIIYCDPVFTSKNIVTVWSVNCFLRLFWIFKDTEKFVSTICTRFSILSHLKFAWYKPKGLQKSNTELYI